MYRSPEMRYKVEGLKEGDNYIWKDVWNTNTGESVTSH